MGTDPRKLQIPHLAVDLRGAHTEAAVRGLPLINGSSVARHVLSHVGKLRLMN